MNVTLYKKKSMHNVITNGSLIFTSVLTFAKESSQRKEFANFSYKNSIDIYLKMEKEK